MAPNGNGSRLIIAPVGGHPAAVFAPLLSATVRPTEGDTIWLVATERTADSANRIRAFFRDKLVSGVDVDVLCVDDAVARVGGHDFPFASCDFLANGGTKEDAFRVIQALHQRVDMTFRQIVSRDHEGLIYSGDGVHLDSFQVEDIGKNELLKFLGLRFAGHRLENPSKGASLEPVLEVQEKSGFLFAALDAAGWNFQDYRQRFLERKRLLNLGLERRRVHLFACDPQLVKRARQDGVPCTGKAYDETGGSWQEEVSSGRIFFRPELSYKKLKQGILQPGRLNTGAKWKGPDLVVVMGTNPRTTLASIWTHKPGNLFLLYDPDHPISVLNCERLMRTPLLECRLVVPVNVHEAAEHLDGRVAENAIVDMKPGDKYSGILIVAWALKNRKTVVLLARASDGSSERQEGPPLDLLFDLTCPTSAGFEGPRFSPARAPQQPLPVVSKKLLEWLAGGQDLRLLHQLWKRRRPPSVKLKGDEVILVLPDGSEVSLGPTSIKNPVADAFHFVTDPEEVKGNWLEYVVGVSLALAGLPLVQLGVLVDPYSTKKGRRGFRDELDIVSYQTGQFAYWSVKTRSRKGLRAMFDEACFQANRFLGRESQAVLVVPFLRGSEARDELWPGMRRQEDGHYRDFLYGDVVDCRFLMKDRVLNEDGIKEVAGFRPELI